MRKVHHAVLLAVLAATPSTNATNASNAQAEDPPTAESYHGGEAIEEVVVVGTRRQARSPGRSPVPVDVISARQLHSQGDGDMLDVLAAQVPSYNVGREPISDAATLLRPANLRGMPADSTLVLVDGKRRHRGAVIGEFVAGINKGAQGVDIAPLVGVALKQIEVLRDGASAHYGSDAIAGVINSCSRTIPTRDASTCNTARPSKATAIRSPPPAWSGRDSATRASRRSPWNSKTARPPAAAVKTRRLHDW